ncbi:MAG: signal peptidase II [Planctomycetota bacterium]
MANDPNPTRPTLPAPGAPSPRAPALGWFFAPLVVILIADLISKQLIFAMDPIDVLQIPWLRHDVNTGVAWSLFSDYPSLVALFTAVLIPILFWAWWRWFRRGGRFENLIFGCIMGGALGNAYDRIMTALGLLDAGGVRDFIYVDLGIWPADPWPTFNVADIGISIGFVGLLLLSFKPPADRGSAATVPESAG